MQDTQKGENKNSLLRRMDNKMDNKSPDYYSFRTVSISLEDSRSCSFNKTSKLLSFENISLFCLLVSGHQEAILERVIKPIYFISDYDYFSNKNKSFVAVFL